MKLKEQELTELFDILKEYQDVFDELTAVESKLKELSEKQLALVDSLTKSREKEKVFTENIIKTYGKGRFNIETLEYELT